MGGGLVVSDIKDTLVGESSWKNKTETLTYRGIRIRIIADFSSKTMQMRNAVVKDMKCWKEREKKQQPRILYPSNFPFKSEG